MGTIALLVGCLGLGALARRSSGLPASTPKVLNFWVLNVALPALILHHLRGASVSGAVIWGALSLWLAFGLALGLGLWALRRGLLTRAQAGALVLCAGLGNTAFLGLPLIEWLGGPAAVPHAVLVDQLGTFLALSVLALPFAAVMGSRGLAPVAVVKRVVTFPPFLALWAALLLGGVVFPGWADTLLTRLGATMSPLALASTGWLLAPGALRGRSRLLAAGLAYKLVAAPALALGLLLLAGESGTLEARVAVAQAAMPPMVTAGVLAAEYDLEPQLAATLVAAGVAASLLSVPGWWWLIGG